ncbi:transporter substrate-binding domain-containing protein [Ornithinibacillus halotolerans]|uniref:Arginine-binding extracellular protein ArtP n=1 Tax=Ornithinibacillus halotolerans TaxID=1274357 RepID=A0A916S524_9BACI|nr:transporter substrate-binding domain-containing protein [Ornithinibacillus halotolerans]GGA84575.1 arginine-binding extracellular protein ArtP [Ornithinibacillus halotolerans]
MRKVIILMISVILLAVLAACGSSEATSDDKKVLKMATSADFPPFETYDDSGNFIGFDIELAQAVADELGYELKIEDMNFDGLIGALQSKRVDLVLSGMSATEKRRKNVDFSDEYHRSGEMFISKADVAIEDLASLKGKVVGVQLGTIQEEGAEVLAEEYGFEIKKIDNASIMIQELNSNRIDVAYMDKTVAIGYINSQGFVGFDDPTTSSPGMAIAFPKGSELVDEVNEVLEKFKEDGTIEKLKEEWLSDFE